jgi:hypothetical protein
VRPAADADDRISFSRASRTAHQPSRSAHQPMGFALYYGWVEGIARLESAVPEDDRLNAIDGVRP